MRRALASVALLVAVAPASSSAATTVQMMVVGHTRTLAPPRNVRLRSATVRIGHRRCHVPAGTALAGLVAARLPLRVTDAAGCDPAAMFVTRIGSESNRGLGGWEYKVGHSDPSAGAADPAGRLRSSQQLLWYWCLRAGACQRTLGLSIHFSAQAVLVTVRGYDDLGHGRAIAGATVHFGSMTYTTGSTGTVQAPLPAGRYLVYATRPGMVRSFPTMVGSVP